MSVFERYLTVWVFLCIVIGVALGHLLPAMFQFLGALSVAQVNLPVGLLIWVMIIPMLVKVDLGALREVRRHVKGIAVTLFVNWLVKPFSMALFGWLFIRHLFAALATLVLLFAFQGQEILQQPSVIGLLAVPILVQVLFNSALAYWLNRAVGESHSIACPSALIGASNFFELAGGRRN